MKTLLKNIDTVVTCDDNDTILHNVDLWMDGGKICHIGSLDVKADKEYDCANMFLYPGLINTHHHLYQYFTRNLEKTQGMELFDWLIALYEIWKNLNEDTVRLSSLAGMGELMHFGCTTCLDHHYVFPSGSGNLICAQFDAAKMLGMRMHACRGSMDMSKKDGGLPPDSLVQDVDTILKDSQRLIQTHHDADPYSMNQVLLAPCSPFSVSDTLLKESALLARAYGVRLHTHLCETKDEENYTLNKVGLRPLGYMETLGWLGNDVFFAHGIHFSDDELNVLKETDTGVCHCPSSNMKLSSGVAKIPTMLKLGVTVGLGVDGSASNDSSNMLSEIRIAYLLHRLTYGSAAPSGYDILKMATRGSAKLLGRDKLGQIKTDCAADMFLIRKDRAELLCANADPKNLFGTVGYQRPCDYVFVGGKCTVADGILCNIDSQKLYYESDKEIKRLLSC